MRQGLLAWDMSWIEINVHIYAITSELFIKDSEALKCAGIIGYTKSTIKRDP
jgi:hypothetical protein